MSWLEDYMEYTEDTESSMLFNKWVGISTIASALRKKVWLEVGRLKVFPNLYIVLVAEPGIARKSQAITYASSIISGVSDIKVAADSTTAQSLFQELEESTTYDRLPDGTPVRHASLSVISKEFESFLGSASQNKMIVTLTDLFDAGEEPWKHRTKSYGAVTIPSVFLNILGATTPQSLLTCLSSLAVGGGLTSRILFVYSDKKHKKVAIPEMTPRLVQLKAELMLGLERISSITGDFSYTPDALEYWKEWYEGYEELSKERLQPRKEFDGWYSRKPLMLQKIALILAASRLGQRTVNIADIQNAEIHLVDVETGMGKVLPEQTADVNVMYYSGVILGYLEQYRSISEKHLMQLLWRDIDENVFDRCVDDLINKRKIVRKFTSPDGKEAIWYHLREEGNAS